MSIALPRPSRSDRERFREHVDGIHWQRMTKMGIRDNRYAVEVPTVTGPVARKRSVHAHAMDHMLNAMKG